VPSVEEIQQSLLDDNTVLIEFFLSSPQSYAWFISRTTFRAEILPSREEIEELASRFYQGVIRSRSWSDGSESDIPKRVFNTVGARLQKALFSNNLERLRGKRLAIIADGLLQRIPFSALPDELLGKGEGAYKPLLLNYEFVHVPSVTAIAVQRSEQKMRKAPSRVLAAFGDPVFSDSDPRVQRHTVREDGIKDTVAEGGAKLRAFVADRGALSRLPGTRREVEGIAELIPETERVVRLDFDANLQEASPGKLEEFSLIHFATHGIVDSQRPELSGLALSLVNRAGAERDGILLMSDISGLRLSAEAVVLSACETGLGKEINGEGTLSLARAFLYAGASRVVMSLWKVNDDSTADLMRTFYQHMLGVSPLDPTAALHKAELTTLARNEWKAPYFWSAFEVQGDWK
jgi:CHAT domain-containing protein